MREKSIDSYKDFIAHIGDREYFGQKLGLERIQSLLKRLGDPQNAFRSIHIAGTNGKGSTAAMLASILKEGGYSVGLFTSPHLEDFCERIQVNGMLIRPDEVLRHASRIQKIEGEAPSGLASTASEGLPIARGGGDASPYEDSLTFFEMATAIGFLHFAEKGVDIAVVETGLGGRLDATNVVTPMASVITSIGKDHTAVLGDTLEEIAFEKAGVIKPARPVVVGSMPAEAMEVIREQASKKGSRFVPLFMNLIPPNVVIGLEGEHQRRNAGLTAAVIDVLGATGDLTVNRDAVWRGLETVRWPGRLETVSEEPWILLDGAHNPEAMAAVRVFLEERLEGRRLKVLFGAMADKDVAGMFAEILPLSQELILTAPALERSASPESLLQSVGDFSGEVRQFQKVPEALKHEVTNLTEDEVLLVTGSFFVVGEARSWFR